LTRPGLGAIVTAFEQSRIIFRRLESYVVYRLASSFLILGFFFGSIVGLGFDFPTWVLILVSIVNDLTVMATSKDNVRKSIRPLVWNVPLLVARAFTLAAVGILQLLLFTHLAGIHSDEDGDSWWVDLGRQCY
jgi:H+-transporting ATPase